MIVVQAPVAQKVDNSFSTDIRNVQWTKIHFQKEIGANTRTSAESNIQIPL